MAGTVVGSTEYKFERPEEGEEAGEEAGKASWRNAEKDALWSAGVLERWSTGALEHWSRETTESHTDCRPPVSAAVLTS